MLADIAASTGGKICNFHQNGKSIGDWRRDCKCDSTHLEQTEFCEVA